MRSAGKKPGAWLMACGLALLAAALLLTGYNLWDERRAQESTDHILAELRSRTQPLAAPASPVPSPSPAPSPTPSSSPTARPVISGTATAAATLAATASPTPSPTPTPAQKMPAVEVEGNQYIGTLDIPSLRLSLPIMESWSYPKLRRAPCRYAGSVYTNDLVIAGHNYRAHFGTLKQLSAGASVIFTDMAGNQFHYNVAEIQVLEPTAVENMLAGGWPLTLFTCTYGGQTRLAVRCVSADGS